MVEYGTPLRGPRRGSVATTPSRVSSAAALSARVYADMTNRLGADGPSVLSANHSW